MQTFTNVFVIMMACASAGIFSVAFLELIRGKKLRTVRGNPNFRRAMGLSLGTVVLYIAMIAGISRVLYDEEQKANNHVQAGSLQLSAKMISLEGTRLSQNGLLENFSETTVVDLNADASSIFSVDGAIPGQMQTATISVKNAGDVAFEYTVLIVDLRVETESDEALARQIRITVSSGNDTTSFLLCDWQLETSVADFGTVLAYESKEFTVSAVFENAADNNAAQNGKVEFDVQIRAVQSNK